MAKSELSAQLTLLDRCDFWDWPEWASDAIVNGLKTDDADLQLTAVMLAAEGMDESIAPIIIDLIRSDAEEELRARAAIALGPTLEECEMDGFEDSDLDEPVITRQLFEEIQRTLRSVYHDPSAPKIVRRRALEASIRAPQSWHAGAVRSSYLSGDEDWQVTAVFCMGFLEGFEAEIIEALQHDSYPILFEAVRAAGNACLDSASRFIRSIAADETADRDLRIVAIEAIPNVAIPDAHELLASLSISEDEQIEEAALLAIEELELWEIPDLLASEDRLDEEY
jgi:uncharacterized protein (UPF0147 family)